MRTRFMFRQLTNGDQVFGRDGVVEVLAMQDNRRGERVLTTRGRTGAVRVDVVPATGPVDVFSLASA